jgi:hypothetical protein
MTQLRLCSFGGSPSAAFMLRFHMLKFVHTPAAVASTAAMRRAGA